MNNISNRFGRGVARMMAVAGFVLSLASATPALAAGPAAVNLLSADNFVILSKTGITNIPTSLITGDIGASPITGAALLVTCSEVTGAIYSVDAAGPLPCRIIDSVLLTAAISDMEAAFIDAQGRTIPSGTELFAGNLGGQTLAPGLYKWSTDVSIPTNLTLSGGANDVWIFQIAGNLDIASGGSVPAGVKVILAGGAVASNVFWQVGGVTGATLGTYSTFNGTILAAKQVILQTGAVLNGRALAQTQVTLDHNTVSFPVDVVPAPVPGGGSEVDGRITGGVGAGSVVGGTIGGGVDGSTISGTVSGGSGGGGGGGGGGSNNGSVLGQSTNNTGSVLAATSFPNTGGGGASKFSAVILNSSVFLLALGTIIYDRRRRALSRIG